jgi:hypothetical protein
MHNQREQERQQSSFVMISGRRVTPTAKAVLLCGHLEAKPGEGDLDVEAANGRIQLAQLQVLIPDVPPLKVQRHYNTSS